MYLTSRETRLQGCEIEHGCTSRDHWQSVVLFEQRPGRRFVAMVRVRAVMVRVAIVAVVRVPTSLTMLLVLKV